jgi:DNA-binding SARP family transcriptional activator
MVTATEIADNECNLELSLLGGFSIKANGVQCDISIKRSKQVLMLIEYIVANRFTHTSFDQFAEILWGEKGEDKEVDNPRGALKNLVWRCRKVLKDSLPADFEEELIVFAENTYSFNNVLACVIDVEELEKLYKILSNSQLKIEYRIQCLEKVTELYSGDFLPGISDIEWVVVRSSYYKRIYVECVNDLLSIYIKNELYDKAIAICELALKYEQYDEKIHIVYIKSLAETNRIDKAIAHYEHVAHIFYRDLGVTVSPELSNFYNEIQNVDKGVEIDINKIITEIDEAVLKTGGFYCSYEVLKNIYRVQFRYAKRNKQSVSIVIMTIHGKLTIQNVTTLMEQLKQSIAACLRTSDCFTRYSINQFLIILPNVGTDNVDKINKRINNAYNSYCKKYKVNLTFTSVVKAHTGPL